MRFLCVRQPTRANIFGEEYDLKPLDARLENIRDILATDNFSAAELLSKHPDILAGVSLHRTSCAGFPKVVDRLEDVDAPGRILIMRNGGIGDHILFLPALRAFRASFPKGTEIWLSAQKEKHPIFLNSSAIDRLLPLPLPMDILFEVDYLIDFSERDELEDFQNLHMTDYYLKFLGIDYIRVPDKSPQIDWDPSGSPKVLALFDRARKSERQKPFVLLNWTASNTLRQLPPDALLFLVHEFPDIHFVVAQHRSLILQTQRDLRRKGIHVLNTTPTMEGLTDYMTAIRLCDAVVTTDTGTVHLAEALEKPCLVLYGPTRDELWIRYYQHVRPLRADYIGDTCCSPCGIQKSENGCPESRVKKSRYSPCLLAITRERIKEAFTRFLGEIEI
jgi:ADP-heptose:LPS heptosyltransferase